MKVLLTILIVTFYFPLKSQIVFEEIVAVPGTFIRDVNESSNGFQAAVTTAAIFGKTVAGSS